MRRLVALLAVPVALCAAACDGPRPSEPAAPAEPAAQSDAVLVTFYPTRYFAERLADGRVEVELPLPEGEDPIYWRPGAEVIQEYQSARLVILNGAKLEKWALTAPLPRSRVVDTAEGFEHEFIEFGHAVTHSHGPAGEHSHAGVDGHTWVDPNLAIQQARAIESAFRVAFPDHADLFAINLMSLEADLRQLNQRLVALTPDIVRVRLLASHPAYNYIAERYGWDIVNLDLDPGEPLDEDDVGRILRAAGDNTAFPIVLLWEGQPLRANVALLRAAGVRSVLFTPAENPSPPELEEHGDYMGIMRANLRRLGDALAPDAP